MTRFSLYQPGSGAWKLSRSVAPQEDAYRAALYDDERLFTRFQLFRRALPIYQMMAAQHAYLHIVHFSTAMPARWRSELLMLADEFPVLVLDEVSAKPSTEAAIARQMELSGAATGPMAWFRVDDDDLLSVDYLDGLSEHVNDQTVGYGVSFGTGFAAVFDNGRLSNFHHVHKPLLGLGLAFVGWFDREKLRLRMPQPSISHSLTDTKVPLILDSREARFIWVHHLGQDTKSASTLEQNLRRIERTFAEFDSVSDPSPLLAKFPTLIDDLRAP